MDRSAVSLERMRSFVRVAERGNLSAVAREFGTGQATVTRHLRELEDALGVRLLSRTTRRVRLTEEGSRYYERCVHILCLVAEASGEMRSGRAGPSGTIRLSCTGALGILRIGRLLHEFQDRYPDIQIELGLTDARVDLVREGIDIALRLGPLADSSMKLRLLGDSERLLVAAPGYLARAGTPREPEDLAGHELVRMSNIAGSGTLSLRDADGRHRQVAMRSRLRVDHGLAARDALAAGRGIGVAHRWLVDDLLTAGQLQALLPRYTLPPVPLSLLIVPERASIARVRLLVDFLAAEIPRVPGIAPAGTQLLPQKPRC